MFEIEIQMHCSLLIVSKKENLESFLEHKNSKMLSELGKAVKIELLVVFISVN